MSNVLVRDIPQNVLAALDAHAARCGISRNEYIRRRLAQDVATMCAPVSVADLRGFSAAFSDLADTSVMNEAWK